MRSRRDRDDVPPFGQVTPTPGLEGLAELLKVPVRSSDALPGKPEAKVELKPDPKRKKRGRRT